MKEELEKLTDLLLLTSGSLAVLKGMQKNRKVLTSVEKYEKTIDELVIIQHISLDDIAKKIKNLEDGE